MFPINSRAAIFYRESVRGGRGRGEGRAKTSRGSGGAGRLLGRVREEEGCCADGESAAMAPIRVNTPFFRAAAAGDNTESGGGETGGGRRRRVPSICVSLPVAATILAYGRLVLLLARLTVSPSISALDLSTYKTRKKW